MYVIETTKRELASGLCFLLEKASNSGVYYLPEIMAISLGNDIPIMQVVTAQWSEIIESGESYMLIGKNGKETLIKKSHAKMIRRIMSKTYSENGYVFFCHGSVNVKEKFRKAFIKAFDGVGHREYEAFKGVVPASEYIISAYRMLGTFFGEEHAIDFIYAALSMTEAEKRHHDMSPW